VSIPNFCKTCLCRLDGGPGYCDTHRADAGRLTARDGGFRIFSAQQHSLGSFQQDVNGLLAEIQAAHQLMLDLMSPAPAPRVSNHSRPTPCACGGCFDGEVDTRRRRHRASGCDAR
jgi:hypothetical protein